MLQCKSILEGEIMNTTTSDIVGTREAAEIIGRTQQTVRWLCEVVKAFQTAQRPGREWIIQRWEVEQYAEQNPGRRRNR